MEELVARLAALPEDNQRDALLQQVARLGVAITPENVAKFSEAARSGSQLSQIGSRIRSRIRVLPDTEQRFEMAQAFLDAEPPSEIGAQIVGLAAMELAVSDPTGVAEWLLDLPADIGGYGDSTALMILATQAPDTGISFLQLLFASGDVARAKQALLQFTDSYAPANPRDAVGWALTLPPEAEPVRGGSIARAFRELAKIDRQAALDSLKMIEDPEILASVRTQIEAVSEQ